MLYVEVLVVIKRIRRNA